ncbi:MAG TPA: Fe-S-containing protein [Terriglobales bacterium]|nr:Fe-S-containing protein [Terriglobales bacterium]
MLQSFIVTLREGVEAALIVGIILAYLAKVGRLDLRRIVYAALGAAVLGSVAAAFVITRLRINQESFEGWVMLAAAFFVITVVVFMARAAHGLRQQIETRVGAFASRGSQIGLFFFVFLMVLREGVETVLILGAMYLNTDELAGLLGTIAGLALAVMFGVMFVKGSVRINLPKFFRVTSVILGFVAAQLLVSGLHELSESGVIPASKESMAVIGPIVRNDLFFFITILALAAMMVLFEARRRVPEAVPAESRAAQRKAAWNARRERLWMGSVYASAFIFIVLVTAQFIYARSTTSLSPAKPVEFVNGEIKVPLSEVYDGDLHRYAAEIDGATVRFLLYQKPDGTIATVLDACEICGPVGFTRGPHGIECKNCAAPIDPQSMGMPGGCNPIPLQARVTETEVVIARADLSTGVSHFQK